MILNKQKEEQTNLIRHLWRMLENELVILEVSKYGKELSIYPASPIQTVFQGNQVVDYWQFPGIEVFKLAIAEGNIKLKYHHFGIFPDQGSNPCTLHWQADS